MQNGENKNMDAWSTHPGDKSAQFARLLADIKGIISEARSAAYAGINAIQIDHNWRIGHRIVVDEQGGKVRAEYGRRTITELSAHLCAEFGDGYSERNLRDFRAFYIVFLNREIWRTRVPNLSCNKVQVESAHSGRAKRRGCQAEGDIDDAIVRERHTEMKTLGKKCFAFAKMEASAIPGNNQVRTEI
ncbi:MAG: DUF1016 N-terminal domain-containing protein [Kiritimatiellia bacterium]